MGQNGLFHMVSPFMELSLKLLPDWRNAYLCANWTAGQKHSPEPRRRSSEVLRLDNTGLWLSFSPADPCAIYWVSVRLILGNHFPSFPGWGQAGVGGVRLYP